MLKILALGLILLQGLVQTKYSWGNCQPYELKQNFDATQYVGLWYQIYRDKDFIFEKGSTCSTAKYGPLSATQISVFNRAILENGDVYTISGRATCQGADCKVKFDWYIPTGSYNVVDTDYTSYAIVYSCSNFLFGLFKAEYAWILARTQTLASEATQIATLQQKVPGYDTNNLYKTPQGGSCVY
ncbi:UNKNOWN [Stylonychia lemnae]|uniref:Lipocalin/cytosolic fatty-acid binding domain-containing protein n=1 Tax=Stylonychia lemnae TaxID=5949 RepID=A0A078AMI5_STYLE|nr:UNKNOWN [Stylonychia lemnae]|eukprot:CDW82602.1 UNKNOWN [Stylonychia lemnae]